MAHYLNKLEFSSHRIALCQISFKLTQWFWRRRLFNLSMCFFYFFIISPWKRSGIFIWTNFNTLHPRMLCAMFHWNKSSNSGEKDFEISSISLLPNYLPLKKEYALHLNKFESPLPKDALCKACLKLAQWFQMKLWEVYRQTDWRMDGRRTIGDQRKLTLAFSRWANRKTKIQHYLFLISIQ